KAESRLFSSHRMRGRMKAVRKPPTWHSRASVRSSLVGPPSDGARRSPAAGRSDWKPASAGGFAVGLNRSSGMGIVSTQSLFELLFRLLRELVGQSRRDQLRQLLLRLVLLAVRLQRL